jgi:hypothetical protein
LKFFRKLLDKFETDAFEQSNSKDDDSDAIFSLTSASISIEEKLGLQFSGTAALCVKVINGTVFKNAIKDCIDLLNVSKNEFKFNFKIVTDAYNYLWVIINGENLMTHSETITNVAAAMSATGDILEENGFSGQILSAIFQFKLSGNTTDQEKIESPTPVDFENDQHKDFSFTAGVEEEQEEEEENSQRSVYRYNNSNSDKNKTNMYLIYNYKTNNFYPYIPIDSVNRDTSRELQIVSILKSLVSVENDFSKWFPIKDIPF